MTVNDFTKPEIVNLDQHVPDNITDKELCGKVSYFWRTEKTNARHYRHNSSPFHNKGPR